MPKRSVRIEGRHTGVCLEDAFWDALKEIAAQRQIGVNSLVASIDAEREQQNLSSAVRLYVLALTGERATITAAGRG